MIFVMGYHPYNKADGVENLIGPFSSKTSADKWIEVALASGAHPDSDFEIVESVDPRSMLVTIQKEMGIDEMKISLEDIRKIVREEIVREMKLGVGSRTPTEKVLNDDAEVDEVAPPGYEKMVRALKKEPNVDNPFAVAWAAKNKGYKKSG